MVGPLGLDLSGRSLRNSEAGRPAAGLAWGPGCDRMAEAHPTTPYQRSEIRHTGASESRGLTFDGSPSGQSGQQTDDGTFADGVSPLEHS